MKEARRAADRGTAILSALQQLLRSVCRWRVHDFIQWSQMKVINEIYMWWRTLPGYRSLPSHLRPHVGSPEGISGGVSVMCTLSCMNQMFRRICCLTVSSKSRKVCRKTYGYSEPLSLKGQNVWAYGTVSTIPVRTLSENCCGWVDCIILSGFTSLQMCLLRKFSIYFLE